MSQKKTLIIVRHAHREKVSGIPDNGLSGKGKKQATAIAKCWQKNFSKIHPVVVSSPRKRCIETIAPLCHDLKIEFKIDKLLDEGGNTTQKARLFKDWWLNQSEEYVVACSHGDVIPELLFELCAIETGLSKGGWSEIIWDGKNAKLVKLLENDELS